MSRRARKLLLPITSLTAAAAALALQAGPADAVAAPTFRITGSVAAGYDAHAVVLDTEKSEAFVAGATTDPKHFPERDAVTVVDTVSKTVVASVQLPAAPNELAYDPTQHVVFASVSQRGSNGAPIAGIVEAIDDSDYAYTSVYVGKGPTSMAVDPVLNRLYVVNSIDGILSVVNPAVNSVVTTVSIPGAVAVTADPVTHHVYVAQSADKLTVVNGTDNSVLTTVALTGKPAALDVDTSAGMVYVGITGGFGAKIAAVKEASESETGTSADLGAAGYITSLTVNPVNHKVYAIAGFWARFIDGPTLSYHGVAYVHRAYGIAVDTASDTVYVAHRGTNRGGGALYILTRTRH